MRRIYFDNASTTKINREVLTGYEKLLESFYVNSESLYDEGSEVHRMLEKARSSIAGLLDINPYEVIFTGGSSESNSAVIKGVSWADRSRKHIITTAIEHSSILNSCAQMERLFGYRVTYLPVNSDGIVRVSDLANALDEDTILVSIMMANNETGAINPIAEIAETVKKKSHAYMHTDMTQAIGKINCSMKNIDLASMSAHKIEGLKGSGILVKRVHVPMEPLISGGEQEYGLRGGTSNACANMMFAKTLRLALEREAKNGAHITQMHDHLMKELKDIEHIEINSPENGVPETVNFSCEAIPSEVMQNALNSAGFMVSARSTCESRSNNPSYVLKAMGMSDRRASSCIRVSLSNENTIEEIDSFIVALKEIIRHYGQI